MQFVACDIFAMRSLFQNKHLNVCFSLWMCLPLMDFCFTLQLLFIFYNCHCISSWTTSNLYLQCNKYTHISLSLSITISISRSLCMVSNRPCVWFCFLFSHFWIRCNNEQQICANELHVVATACLLHTCWVDEFIRKEMEELAITWQESCWTQL